MAHIFISYSRKDKQIAQQLAADLEWLGGDVWIDMEDIHPAEDWTETIHQALNECPVMILVVTPASMQSSNVADEWKFFHKRGKTILPVLFEPAEVNFKLENLQYIDFYEQDYDTAFKQLHSELWRHSIPLKPISPPYSSVQIPAQPPLRKRKRRSGINPGYLIIVAVVALIGVIAFLLFNFGDDKEPGTKESTSTQAVLPPTDEAQPTDTPEPTYTITPSPTAPAGTPEPNPTIPPSPMIPIDTPTLIPAGSENRDVWPKPTIQAFDGIEMAYVPSGCFMMGRADRYEDEQPVHEVCLDAFWIDRTEVTNRMIGSIGGFPWAENPRESINWIEAQSFCESRGGRLPTEAEWEYAARGPSGWMYAWGDVDLTNQAIYNASSTAPVSSLQVTSWVGAYDMNGNVAEWVADWYGLYSTSDGATYNPTGPAEGTVKVVRGGSWFDTSPDGLRSELRYWRTPEEQLSTVGFRCVRDD